MSVVDLQSYRVHLTGAEDEIEDDGRAASFNGRQPRTRAQYFGQTSEAELAAEFDRQQARKARREERLKPVWSLLLRTADHHAALLARRLPREDVIAELIEHEILKDARWILKGSVPANKIPHILRDFVEVLWAKIHAAGKK